MSDRCVVWRVVLCLHVIVPAMADAQQNTSVPCTVGDQPSAIIGRAAGSEFGAVTGAAVVRDTIIVIGDGRADQLRFYTVSGRSIGTFGRRGQGPGEFRDIRRVFARGDTVAVFDQSGRRASLFTPSGEFVRSFAAPWGMVGLLDRDAKVTAANPVGSSRGRNGPELWPDSLDVSIDDTRGSRLLHRIRDRTRIVTASGVFGVYDAPFTRVPSVVADSDVIVVADGSGEIRRFRSDGSRLPSVRSPFGTRRLTRADLERWIDTRLRAYDESNRPAMRRLFSVAQLPPTTPAHGPVILDRAARIWIQEYRPFYELVPVGIAAVNDRGDVLVRASIPPRSKILAASADALVVSTADEYDAEVVNVFRIRCRR
jgi:hypothetical protein